MAVKDNQGVVGLPDLERRDNPIGPTPELARDKDLAEAVSGTGPNTKPMEAPPGDKAKQDVLDSVAAIRDRQQGGLTRTGALADLYEAFGKLTHETILKLDAAALRLPDVHRASWDAVRIAYDQASVIANSGK